MTTIAMKRIFKDIRNIAEDEMTREEFGIQLPDDIMETPMNFNVAISGPPGTPYASGTFRLKVAVPSDYPFSPLKVKFLTPVWHANVSPTTGYICLDTLSNRWGSSMNLRSTLISLHCLLASGDPLSPQNGQAGGQMLDSPEIFSNTAMMWTYIHAHGSHYVEDYLDKITSMMEMGLGGSREELLSILSDCDWDMDRAVAFFFPITSAFFFM